MAKSPKQAPPLYILLKPDQRKRLEATAKRAEMPLSSWARQQLLALSEKGGKS